MEKSEFSKPITLNKVRVTDTFWKNEMELVRKVVIPYQWEALNDNIEGAAPSFCMHNFKTAAKITKKRAELGSDYEEVKYPTDKFEVLPEDKNNLEDRFYGFVFQDSDFAKWIEAVAYTLAQYPDDKLEEVADEAIKIVCEAQQPNGYLDTFYIINDMGKTFTNLRDHHELYCFGHLTEGAVAYYEATGKKELLSAVERYADYIESLFGNEEGKKKGYPGHEIAEMALTKLYEVTGNEKYLKLGKFFVDERGKKPYYFDIEHNVLEVNDTLRYQYHQAHLPVREQTEAVGHAVRAVYLYSGMTDVARLTQDEGLYDACENLWNDIVNRKMYITGGVGATVVGEAFSFAYDLPNDTAYSETCAAIGLVFFARRMLQVKAVSKYADVMERALYNTILSGMALDGQSFFYVNPLEVVPEACHKDTRKEHVKPVRQKWYGCACCPPNLARLISSIASYAFTETDDKMYIHLYLGCNIVKEINGKKVDICINSTLPWEGNISITVKAEEPVDFTMALRIPGWSTGYHIDAPESSTVVKDGYYYLTKVWMGEETIQLNFNMNVRRVKSDPKVRENIGKVAIMRGPVVYCLEEADNGNNLHLVSLPKESALTVQKEKKFNQDYDIPVIRGIGNKIANKPSDRLYIDEQEELIEEVPLTWIPYYTWANRGEGEMLIWIRE